MSKNVLVIGGGPAGVSAAKTLGKLGISTILVEKEQKLGGRPVLEAKFLVGQVPTCMNGVTIWTLS
jgi:heterodisulfide reductase subunit A-like polyferredoxin